MPAGSLHFGNAIEWPHVRRILLFGLPACAAGAYGYTLLAGGTIALLIGTFLILSVPLRRWLVHANYSVGPRVERGAGAVFGFINGGMTGTGTVLIAILMAAGVQGPALIATDAVISFTMGVAKVALFGTFERLNAELMLAGIADRRVHDAGRVRRALAASTHSDADPHRVHGGDRARRRRRFSVAGAAVLTGSGRHRRRGRSEPSRR